MWAGKGSSRKLNLFIRNLITLQKSLNDLNLLVFVAQKSNHYTNLNPDPTFNPDPDHKPSLPLNTSIQQPVDNTIFNKYRQDSRHTLSDSLPNSLLFCFYFLGSILILMWGFSGRAFKNTWIQITFHRINNQEDTYFEMW